MILCSDQEIKVIKDNSNYNIYNILKGTPDDPDWLSKRIRLLKCKNTILGIYYNISAPVVDIYTPGFNIGYFHLAIEQYINTFHPELPGHNECCVYFRVGDKTFDPGGVNLLDFDYKTFIKRSNCKVITIICCISFSSIRDDWQYSHEKLNKCKNEMKSIINDIISSFPDKKVKIVSNSNPDNDICYLYKSKFIAHPRSSWSKLCKKYS